MLYFLNKNYVNDMTKRIPSEKNLSSLGAVPGLAMNIVQSNDKLGKICKEITIKLLEKNNGSSLIVKKVFSNIPYVTQSWLFFWSTLLSFPLKGFGQFLSKNIRNASIIQFKHYFRLELTSEIILFPKSHLNLPDHYVLLW